MKPVDWAERKKIVEDLGTTFLVEAGAGSGKTKSLVDRMIALLRSSTCKIDTLAAVTFTRKAAAELRERFQTSLEREYAAAAGEERRRFGESLRNLEQCFIGTIHSFCGRMLRERPIEMALMPDFEEMDDIEDAVFREKCWIDYLVKVRREQPGELLALEEVGLEPEDLKDSFSVISMYPEVTVIKGSDEPPDFKWIRSQLEVYLERVRAVVPYKGQDEARDDFYKKMTHLFVRQKNIGFSNPLDLMATMEDMDKDFKVTQKHWPDKKTAVDAKAEFDVFRAGVVKTALKGWRQYRHERIIDFLKPAVKFYFEERKRHSLVNFADLILSVSSLLRNNPQVRDYFQKKYTHILVDEFQDTDPVQAEILMYLTGADLEERDWRKVKPRAGSLFLVGDPKQSIYRFRRADIDTYNVAKKQIKRSGGDVLSLTANFRSLDSLAEWNNPLFKETFPEESSSHQAPFALMNTVREDKIGVWSGVYKITNEKRYRNLGKLIAADDAAAIADWIGWATDGNVKLLRSEEEKARGLGESAVPSDFLILFRYKKNMGFYARALEERGIPYEITGSDVFSDSEDIGEIVCLARALRDPDNEVLVVSVLRGIFFGASDNALLEYKREGGRFSFLGTIEGGKSQGAKYVGECLVELNKWWRWTKEYAASAAVEKIFEDSGIINYLASSEMGSSKAGNVLKFLEFLRSRERDGRTSFSDVVEYMEELIEVKDVEEMSLTPGRMEAVRLMNLHKAKGLEAPVVFLANPVGSKYFEPDKHVVRLEEGGPKGYFLFKKKVWFSDTVLSQPLDWAEKMKEEKLYEAAEEERLMYVAATRARNMLVISSYEAPMTRKAWGLLDGYLGDVDELVIPEPAGVVEKKEVSVSKKQFEDVRAGLKGNIEQGMEPSYLVESVTSLAKAEGELPGWSESGRGMSWGRVVHHVLNVVGRGDDVDLELLVRNALVAEERDLGEKWRMLDLIEAILGSEFWARMLRAERKYFEIPFSVKTDSKALGLNEPGNGKDVILTGVIDLVFWEEGGWVIADYKTDEIERSVKKFVDYYSPQVKIYSQFWEQITGEPVKEAGLYFTSINHWEKIRGLACKT